MPTKTLTRKLFHFQAYLVKMKYISIQKELTGIWRCFICVIEKAELL